jgi:hypothetical protein
MKSTGFRVKPGTTYFTTIACLCTRRISCLFLVFALGLVMAGCMTPKEQLHSHGDLAPVKTYPKDYVHPLSEINLEKVIDENRGLRVLEENAKTVNDYYRAGVQEKAEGERLLKEKKWEEARKHFRKSNWFLQVVIDYLPKDEAYRNIYGDHVVIFLPNLIISDNYLKLVTIFQKLKMDEEIYWESREGKKYLSFSLKNVKTEWAFQVQKGFEEVSPKK